MKIKVGDLVYDETLAYRRDYEIFVLVEMKESKEPFHYQKNKYTLYSLKRKKIYSSFAVIKIEEHHRELKELEKINEN